MREYKANIVECSKELNIKEKIRLKDGYTQSIDALSQDAVFNGEKLIIDVDYYAIVEVHNPHAENTDYTRLIIVDKNGEKYSTGSTNFIDAFINIYQEMKGAGEEEIQIECLRRESNNYKGKDFLTCTIA